MTEQALVPMEKDGERLEVHPSCVANHEQIGWRVTEAASATEPQEPKRRGRKNDVKD